MLEDVLIELLRTDILLVKPTVEMADEPELDSSVDPRKAIGHRSATIRRERSAFSKSTSKRLYDN